GYTHHRILAKGAATEGVMEANQGSAKQTKTDKSMAAATDKVGDMSNILAREDTELAEASLDGAPKFYSSLVINTEAENSYIQQQFNEAFIEIVKEIRQ